MHDAFLATNASITLDQAISLAVGSVVSTVLTVGVRAIIAIRRNVTQVSAALVTAEPTALNPNPPLGALDILRQHVGIIESHDKTLGVLLVASKTLIDQREAPRNHDGHDLRPADALRLIEEEQRRRATEKAVRLDGRH